MDVNYSALSELHGLGVPYQGRGSFTLFGACPWLSYSAPSALPWLSYSAPSALACPLAVLFRAFGACLGLSYSASSSPAFPALSYSAPSAHASGCHIPRLRRWH